ncbi:MAG: carboxylating nicotinate-nucleotide diphosphorylase [Phycisphaerales bacterium]|nr:MAG: carboxylating nicotinate-nucleotide diphosphorylase [Phycisphaerales bacterium]
MMQANVVDMQAVKQQAVRLARMARDEDLGQRGDITSSLIPGEDQATFRLVSNEPGVFAGRQIAAEVLSVFDGRIRLKWMEAGRDGHRLDIPAVHLATLAGPERMVLSAERTLLNFLQRLSGIATTTRLYVDAVAGTGAKIFDTRKTTPGWRVLEKYAVRCGGGHNHRLGLDDAVLIKDNHLARVPIERLAETVFAMVTEARALDPKPAFVEVEVDRLEQVEPLLVVVGIDVILLDNFSRGDTRAAVALRDKRGLRGKVQLEVSGRVTLDTVRAIAETGVERISVGAITHSAPALDLSLEQV